MTGFIQRAPTRTNILSAHVTIGQKAQSPKPEGSPTLAKATWISSQGLKWKVTSRGNPNATTPLAAQKQRLQEKISATSPASNKAISERSTTNQATQKVKFEALKEAAKEKSSLQNRPEITSALKKAGYDPNPILSPKRILPENLVGELKPLGAGALNQAYTGIFKTEDGKHMEVIIKFEQQYKTRGEMPEFLMGIGVQPQDARESSRNLAAKTLDTLLKGENIVHTELGVLKDPITQEYRVVTAMAKAEGTSGYGKILGETIVSNAQQIGSYATIKGEINDLNKRIQRQSSNKEKIQNALNDNSKTLQSLQQKYNKLGKLQLIEKRKLDQEKTSLKAKITDLETQLNQTTNYINNLNQELESCKLSNHTNLANLRFYSESGIEEIKDEKGNLTGLKGPQLGHNIDPHDPKLKEELIKLQLQDIIMSQGDRHIGNYFIKTEPGADGKEKVVGIQGIDNDQLGGTFKTLEKSHNLKDLPPEIPSSVCKDIINLKPDEFQHSMECCLPKAEAEAATARLKLVQEHCKKALDNNITNGEGSQLFKYNYNNSYYMNFLSVHFTNIAENIVNAA